jgi:uncharacterized membrane protein YgcG
MSNYKCINSFTIENKTYSYGDKISSYDYNSLPYSHQSNFREEDDAATSFNSSSMNDDTPFSSYSNTSSFDFGSSDSSSSSSNDFGGGDFGGGGSGSNW